MKKVFIFITALLLSITAYCQHTTHKPIIPGAERMELYLPLLKNKSVAVFANQTSMVKHTHLVDTLLARGIKVVKIFGPEHGFRGDANAGEHVDNSIDNKTGIPVISLYGDHKKPRPEDLTDIDILLFDIQDVGVRFYTFISSMQYCLEAALENQTCFLLLDRPNPNGFYVDGPVLDIKCRSFIGMQPVPIVYGMTMGEYATMLIGEKWLSPQANKAKAKVGSTENTTQFSVIRCKDYSHMDKYILPVAPSPNLKDMQSVYLYPSTCLFEGTVLSEGRGTDKPFQIFGHPNLPDTLFSFTPKPNAGAKSSKCFYQKCYGWNLSGTTEEVLKATNKKIQIQYFIEAYQLFPGKDSFFLKNNFIDKLAGTQIFKTQIKEGNGEAEIRDSWEPLLSQFKKIRKKYLLYSDFETPLSPKGLLDPIFKKKNK
ncbi:MAG: DUF1343 domain-containing protein [Sphingobacteriales bacterium]|nr:DUF1343 domain-containing protein [Sphingobacteriales bacterium]